MPICRFYSLFVGQVVEDACPVRPVEDPAGRGRSSSGKPPVFKTINPSTSSSSCYDRFRRSFPYSEAVRPNISLSTWWRRLQFSIWWYDIYILYRVRKYALFIDILIVRREPKTTHLISWFISEPFRRAFRTTETLYT